VVDEAALVHALESAKIAGAGLDVFEQEPFIHSGLKRPNVVLAPHLGSASNETRAKNGAGCRAECGRAVPRAAAS